MGTYKYYDAASKTLVNKCPETYKFVEMNKTCVSKCQFDAYELDNEEFVCIISKCYATT